MSSVIYFNQIADQWDTMREGFFSEAVREAALAAAKVQSGQTAADIGAGSGFLTEALLSNGLEVIAVDPSPAMLEVMQAKFGESAVYRLGDADHPLPLQNGEADYAFANMVLHHVENPAFAIQEMARTVKSGGKVVITDLDEHPFEFLREEQHDRWLGFPRGQVQAWLEAAGLEQVSVNSVGANCCSDSACGTQRADVSIFLAVGVKKH